MRTSFFEIGVQYGPPAFGRQSILDPIFSGLWSVFTDTSAPESPYFPIVILQRWFPILNIGQVLTDNLLDIYSSQISIEQKSVGIGKYRPMFEKSVGIEKYRPIFDDQNFMAYLDSTC